jgi:hypothetical protein
MQRWEYLLPSAPPLYYGCLLVSTDKTGRKRKGGVYFYPRNQAPTFLETDWENVRKRTSMYPVTYIARMGIIPRLSIRAE